MKRRMIRYRTKPEQVQANERLIQRVFEELHAKSPAGVRYMVMKLSDGTFVHFVANENPDGANPLLALDAFRTFQSGIDERCLEQPQADEPTIVGNYRMLAD